MPRLSIILPAYQAEQTIVGTIQSALHSSYEDFELLVVDDGSTDGTAGLVQGVAKSDNRVRLISKENGGVSSARNYGIQEATGKYLMFLDSDDFYLPSYCELMVRRMEETNADIVLAGYEECYGTKTVTRLCPVFGQLTTAEQIYENFIYPTYCSGLNGYLGSVCIAIFRRSHVLHWNIRFAQTVKIAEDKLFLVEYLLHSQRMATVDSPQYRYVLRTGSATKRYQAPNENTGDYSKLWHKILTQAGHPPDSEMLARETIAGVFSVIVNEARPGNPKPFFCTTRCVFLCGRPYRHQIRSIKPNNRTLRIKQMIAANGVLCVLYFLYRRWLCLLG